MDRKTDKVMMMLIKVLLPEKRFEFHIAHAWHCHAKAQQKTLLMKFLIQSTRITSHVKFRTFQNGYNSVKYSCKSFCDLLKCDFSVIVSELCISSPANRPHKVTDQQFLKWCFRISWV